MYVCPGDTEIILYCKKDQSSSVGQENAPKLNSHVLDCFSIFFNMCISFFLIMYYLIGR